MNKKAKIAEIHYTRKMLVMKSAAKNVRRTEFYAVILASVILAAFLLLSPVISSIISSITFGTGGIVRVAGPQNSVMALSGSAEDIQAAINEAEATQATAVFIPEGTWDFLPASGGTWQRVTVTMADFPNGLTISGMPTERTSGLTVPFYGMNPNDQVLNDNWRTVLRLQYDYPSGGDPADPFFYVSGDNDLNKFFRFTDLKLVGYREINPDSTQQHRPLVLQNVGLFRVDHCYFKNCASPTEQRVSANRFSKGVIDHCKLENSVGIPEPYSSRTVDYGIMQKSPSTTRWEDASLIMGKFTDYSLYIEDCYFEKWRHCVSTSEGMHWVFRYSTIQYDYGYSSLDNHGAYSIQTRATEIYRSNFLDRVVPDPYYGYSPKAIQVNCGDMAIFDNYCDDSYNIFVYLWNRGTSSVGYTDPETTKLYVWDNNLESGVTLLAPDSSYEEGSEYFLYTRPDYTPYPYPHPLTLEQ